MMKKYTFGSVIALLLFNCSCSSSNADPIAILSQVSNNQSEIIMECIVCGGTTISLAGNETIGSIDDGHRIQFGLIDPKGRSMHKGDANAILTYVNRSQEILVVAITINISTSDFTMINLTCGSDHVNESISVPIGDAGQSENAISDSIEITTTTSTQSKSKCTSFLSTPTVGDPKNATTRNSAQSTSKCTSFLSIVFIALTSLPLTV